MHSSAAKRITRLKAALCALLCLFIATATQAFTGRYLDAATQVSADITKDKSLVRGTFRLDSQNYQILGTTTGANTFSGKIFDHSNGKFYQMAAQLQHTTLSLAILIPEQDNKVINLLLTKTTSTASTTPAQPKAAINTKEKNPKLIGTWRYTEVLSSGFGDNNASLATDYFIQFKPNGECLSWAGSSAGGSKDVSLDSRGNGDVTREEWYTEGKKVIFIDPQTREESSLTFFAEDSRMLLKGSSSKVYQRVR
ncbi:hypothetical protein MCEMSEM18_02270 [Comamonadaceae bacterium]